MSDEFTVSPVRFSHLTRRGVLLGLTVGQLTATGIAVVTVIGSLYTGRSAALAVTAPIWATCIAAAFVPIQGRAAIDWTPTAGHWLLRRATRQTSYRRRIERPIPAGLLALPGDASHLQQYDDPVSGAVMIHDPKQHTLTAIVTVTHAAFVLQDPTAQQRRIDGFGRVLATICRSGRIARLQVLERTLPDTGAGLTDWWLRRGTTDDSFPARTYRSLIDRAGPAAELHATTLSLALDLTRTTRPVRAAGGGLRGAAAVLRQEMDTLTAALRNAGLRPAGWIDSAQLAKTLLAAYDPRTANSHPARIEPRVPGPVGVDEHWDRLRTDSAHHAVLWISEWPRQQVYPGFLAPLVLTTGVRRTISITYSPVPAEQAARTLRRRKTEYLADSAGRVRFGQLDDARHGAEYSDVLQQEADLTAGHGILNYTGLITITAPTLDALETAIATIEQAAIQASCETRRLVGQQAQGFAAAALPLARSL
jgi:hypothetical protein